MKIDFNFDWMFHPGDLSGWEDPELPDSSWRMIDVPHDWCYTESPYSIHRFEI